MAKFLFYDDKIINILQQDERPSGGAAVQAYGWIRGLSKIGQDISVLTNVNHQVPLKDECKDIKLIPLYDHQKGIRWLRWGYYRLPHIYKKISGAKPDYLYQGIPGWTSFLIGSVCHYLNVKYLLRISNDNLVDERFFKNYSKTHYFFLNLGFKLAYCILCQNDYQLEKVKKRFPNKLAIKIPNPIFSNYHEDRRDIETKNYIAWVGLFQYQKNLKLLYEIACLLKSEVFYIAGKESAKVDSETCLYLQKLSQLPNVKFVGFLQRHEVLPFLSQAKFLLNTSHYEGFSNTFLEAMTAGTPIVSSNKVNPDNMILSNELGIVYKDSQDLSEQLQSLSNDQYKKMSDNALRYVLEHHDCQSLAGKLVNFLNAN